ncbi:MAG: bifunctional serine/threonine-protein kinase/formylglycine-generating enzyme family protein [Planctomycetota bacterium]
MNTEGPRVPQQPLLIGPYHVLETLGEGGMGVVYLAEQREPVRRRVALKVIKAGMDSKAVLRRFEAERQALAMMEHSCIATVLDAGLTSTGQPFFAMEYVKGIPITEYCDLHKLGLPERIALFQKVCSGVQHAHLKGVMHRDIKPSNVLVTLQDGKPMPKIIDFGLAKATNHHLVEATLFTEQGVVIGTPEYMSPEQAGLGGLDVDTRTDVYSLGVLLYELLVGELPFSRQALRDAGMLEMQRVIREQEPTKPSTKITTLGEQANQLAAVRRLATGELQKKLRGDLDWILLKALEKDRTRRYETALELAADLQRHLDFESVLASPPSLAYRLRKFVRRYRAQCAAGAVMLAAVLFTGVMMVWALGVARDRADQVEAMLLAERAASERNRIYADAAKLAEAIANQATLYPAWPEQVPAIRNWLQSYADPLQEELTFLGLALARMEAQARPMTPAESDSHRRAHPRHAEVQHLQWLLDHTAPPESRDTLRREIALLEAEIRDSARPVVDPADRHLYGTLSKLVGDLELFLRDGGLVSSVRDRLRRAETVQARSFDSVQDRWREAIDAIKASDGERASRLYERMSIKAQVGLVPIGMDPESKLWQFVDLDSGTPGKEAPSGDPGRLQPTPDMGVVFVLIPGGTLPVEAGEPATGRNELRLSPFFFSKYEMTQGQWMRLSGGHNPSRHSSVGIMLGDVTCPVENVSWLECEEKLRQSGWALPTELQWEYGCRAGTTSPWWTGSSESSLTGKELIGHSADQRLEVGSLAPNPFGLHDMAGNVWEWCRDGDGNLGSERGGDGLRLRSDDDSTRAVRGGGYGSSAATARSVVRGVYPCTFRFGRLGLRPVRPLDL